MHSLETTVAESPAWMKALAGVAKQASAAAKEVSFSTGISERDLLKQLLLHLPRFSPGQIKDAQRVGSEAERLAGRLLRLRLAYGHWANRPRIEIFQKASLRFVPCGDDVARVIHERFHYVGWFREGRHLALFSAPSGDVPLALLTLSPMDIPHLSAMYPSALDRSRVLVLSRLFAFDWAPRNSVSYLLGQTSKWIHAEAPQVDTLLTYLNPNLGFTGASYWAANWSEFLEVPARYAYLKGNYITFRKLRSLTASEKRAVRYSQYQLEPLKILRYQLPRRFQFNRAAVKGEMLPCFN